LQVANFQYDDMSWYNKVNPCKGVCSYYISRNVGTSRIWWYLRYHTTLEIFTLQISPDSRKL